MKRRARVLLSVLALSGLGVTACDAADQPPEIPATGDLPADHPPIADGAVAPGRPAANQEVAVVKETMNAGGYTYVRAEIGGQEIWLAGPETELAADDLIAVSGGMAMENFESPSLGRTFETIYFVNAFYVLSEDDVAEMEATGAGGTEFTGKVLQAVTTAGYTYVEVETADGKIWLAGPSVEIEEGVTVAWPEGMLMKDFESKTLERTFAEIYFVGALTVIK